MDIRLALMTGVDIPVPEIQVSIHQPSILEISYLGEKGFFSAAQFLCIQKKSFIKDKALLESTTNFQVFMTAIQDSKNRESYNYVQSLLSIIFPHHKILFTPQSIILNNMEAQQTINIDSNNFEALQKVLLDVFCLKDNSRGDTQLNFNPADKKAQEIADKLMAGRRKLAEEKGEANECVLGRYLSILAITQTGLTLTECCKLTLYQLYDLIERYKLFVNWDIDIRSRLAGAKPQSKADNWMVNIH